MEMSKKVGETVDHAKEKIDSAMSQYASFGIAGILGGAHK